MLRRLTVARNAVALPARTAGPAHAQVALSVLSGLSIPSCSGLLDGFGSGPDEARHVLGVRDHNQMACRDFDGRGAHALGELALGVSRDGLIVLCDQEPGRV